jgi:hypothetical protein
MPGFLLHVGAIVTCAHGGQAQQTVASLRVSVMGQQVVTAVAPYVVAGCAFAPPVGNGPCVTAQWVTSATRVSSMGQPLLLIDSQAICAPTATPLLIVTTQTRATGM